MGMRKSFLPLCILTRKPLAAKTAVYVDVIRDYDS